MADSSRSEQHIIERWFAPLGLANASVELGIGDDAAVLNVPAGEQLVTSVDTLVEDVHFRAFDSPAAIGHKALAVNLSDMAAMGATPHWATLALTLPQINDNWLDEFTAGFGALAKRFDVALVGGDLSRGALTISVQIMGTLPVGQALRRSGANVGDLICVSGRLGDAAVELRRRLRGEPVRADSPLDFPQPRLALGVALRGYATAAIDVSDGLLRDLQRLLTASNAGATINAAEIPTGDLDMALHGGDDYELCFTAPALCEHPIAEIAAQAGVPLTEIGVVESAAGLRLRDAGGGVTEPSIKGFDHFG